MKIPEIVTEAGRHAYWETPKGTSIEDTVDAIFTDMARALVEHAKREDDLRQSDRLYFLMHGSC